MKLLVRRTAYAECIRREPVPRFYREAYRCYLTASVVYAPVGVHLLVRARREWQRALWRWLPRNRLWLCYNNWQHRRSLAHLEAALDAVPVDLRRHRHGGLVPAQPQQTAPEFVEEMLERGCDVRMRMANATFHYTSPHEHDLRTIRVNFQGDRELRLDNIGYEQLLDDHYRKGTPHPHDYNLPLNHWNDYQ